MLHSIVVVSVLPYVQKRYIREGNDFDSAVYRLTWALKDGRQVLDSQKTPREPCDVVVKFVEACDALAADRVLVPVPRKSITPEDPDPAKWPGLRLSAALHGAGYGKGVRVALRRHAVVAGSTGKTSQADRVTVQQHIDSLACDLKVLARADKVTLVDDVLTSGTQLMGAMRALQLAGFAGSVMAVTAFHALSNPLTRERNERSTVHWDGESGWANR